MNDARYMAGTLPRGLRPIPDTRASLLYMFNPTLNYRNYMIPALMVVLLVVICGIKAIYKPSDKDTEGYNQQARNPERYKL